MGRSWVMAWGSIAGNSTMDTPIVDASRVPTLFSRRRRRRHPLLRLQRMVRHTYG